MTLFAYCDPTNFENVVEEEKFKDTMDTKIKSIAKNDTLEPTNLPQGHKSSTRT